MPKSQNDAVEDIFVGLDLDSVPDNPWDVNSDTYLCEVAETKIAPTAKGDKEGLTILFEVLEGPFEGRKIRDWKEVVRPADPTHLTAHEMNCMSHIKDRYLALGVPAEEIKTTRPSALVKRKAWVTVVKTERGMNVRSVKPYVQDSDELPSFS